MDFDFGSLIQQGLNLMPGSDGANPGVGMAGPAFLAALQQYNNAGQYKDTANKAAQDASPVSTTDRRFYTDRLAQSYKDPSFMLNDPGHAIQRARGLDEVASNDAMKGYMGSGNMAVDLSKYASESDQSFLEQERERMGKLGGFQFDPANAAAIRVKGDENSINAKNQALATMMAPFLANMSQNRINNGKNPTDVDVTKLNGLTSPKDISAQIAGLVSSTGKSAAEIMQWLLNNPNVSPSTAAIIQDIGGNGAGGLTGLPADGSGGFSAPPLNPFDPNAMGPPSPGLPGFQTQPFEPGYGGNTTPEIGESVSGNYGDGAVFNNFLQDL